MTSRQFRKLPFNECAEFLLNNGDYITHREHYNQKRVLYRCYNFLGEAWYDPKENEITKVTVIGLVKALKFYWRSVDIENVVGEY